MADKELKEELKASEDFESMLQESFKKQKTKKIVSGVVVEVNEEHVLVDVGEKIEGKIPISEFLKGSGSIEIKPGDKIPVLIIGYKDERPLLSYQKAVKKEKNLNYIKELGPDYKDKIIEAEIVRKNKGGYVLTNDGVEFFMPTFAAMIKDESKIMGKKIKVCIIDVKPDSAGIVVSRKRFFELDNQERAQKVKKILESENRIFKGKILKITSFGMFVDVEGIEGLVHYTEISYKGPVNPAKLFKEGDEIEVKVLDYDKEKRRLSLSVKAVMDDPWQEIKNELEVGDTIKVTVSNIEPYGAFVDLGNDIEGFLHISEISWDKNIKHPSEYIKEGQELDVEVIEIDPEKRKLRVSLKKLQPKPFDTFIMTHKEGEILKGTITTLTEFGAFVKIDGIEGLLHNEDAFWGKNQKCKNEFKEGDEIEVKIAKIDKEKERVSLTRKGVIEGPIEAFAKKHKVDELIKGKIRDIKDFGVFVSIDENIDALIRNEDLAPLRKDELKIGQEIEGVISLIDVENNRVRLSIKKMERRKEKEQIREMNTRNSDKVTLGELIKEKS